MRIRIFGTEIYMTFLFFAVVAFLIITDRTGLVLPTFFCVLLHESAHLFAMWLCDCQPKKIRLSPAQIEIVSKMSARKCGDVFVTLAGPLSNLLLCAVLYLNFRLFKNHTVFVFCVLNAVIGTYNLLPVSGLDGGTLFYTAVAKISKSEEIAQKSLFISTLLLATAVSFLAVFLTLKGSIKLSVYIVAVYLFVCALLKK